MTPRQIAEAGMAHRAAMDALHALDVLRDHDALTDAEADTLNRAYARVSDISDRIYLALSEEVGL